MNSPITIRIDNNAVAIKYDELQTTHVMSYEHFIGYLRRNIHKSGEGTRNICGISEPPLYTGLVNRVMCSNGTYEDSVYVPFGGSVPHVADTGGYSRFEGIEYKPKDFALLGAIGYLVEVKYTYDNYGSAKRTDRAAMRLVVPKTPLTVVRTLKDIREGCFLVRPPMPNIFTTGELCYDESIATSPEGLAEAVVTRFITSKSTSDLLTVYGDYTSTFDIDLDADDVARSRSRPTSSASKSISNVLV